MLDGKYKLPPVEARRVVAGTPPFCLPIDQGHHADVSADISFGPTAPKDPNANWIKTIPGRGFFGGFRFYGPT
jgi:hypothetical protein